MAVRTQMTIRSFGDAKDRARKTLLRRFSEFEVETLAALKALNSIPSDTLNEAIRAARILGMPNPTVSMLRREPDFEGPLILPAPPKDPKRRHSQPKKAKRNTMTDAKTRMTPPSFGDAEGGARTLLLRLFSEFNVETLAALNEVTSIPRETLSEAIRAARILGMPNPTVSILRREPDFEGPLILPAPPKDPKLGNDQAKRTGKRTKKPKPALEVPVAFLPSPKQRRDIPTPMRD